ncbi:histidinol-phosphatase [Schlesneria paludicola]|uniref:histidinol-phosphatase n=1 Tax=Schlesneria paludicola TaxID=360056 RepID=UPI00029A8820|nr:histidinol-phosphatase [Schlesneria paludicola]
MTRPAAATEPSPEDLASRLEFALRVAEEAQGLILSYYQSADLVVERKRDATPVTEADKQTEVLIRDRLAVAFPDDAILGEEFPGKDGTTGFRWILDPIDGTKSFVHGVPLFGTLIGIEYGTKCVVGVCRFPALNEVVYAAKGTGAWWKIGDEEPRPARVSGVTELADATFCTTNPSRWYNIGRRDTYETLIGSVQLARGWGDCFGHILVATGRAELMVDPSLNAWDAAALVPILEEAGGHFVDWTGEATIYGGSGLSVVPGLKDTVLSLLKKKYVIDGDNFSTLEEFYDEISRVLIPGVEWGRNLSALNDLLRGGFGTPAGGFQLEWKNATISRQRLGYPETIRQLEQHLERCHPSNKASVEYDLDVARAHRGSTVYDWLMDLFREHGEGGSEAGSGVELVVD